MAFKRTIKGYQLVDKRPELETKLYTTQQIEAAFRDYAARHKADSELTQIELDRFLKILKKY